MNALNIDEVKNFVNKNIITFHENKIKSIRKLSLHKILRKKNPYLFRAKNIIQAHDLIEELLDAHITSSEEKIFGDFLEELAIFIASRTCNGAKSAATGIDLEFSDNDIRYLVSIKSGPNWGNSSQQRRLEDDFKKAVSTLKQSRYTLNIQPVLGICYGKTKTSHVRGYYKVVGQNFWYLISNRKSLYADIIEPLGYKAKQHNQNFIEEKGRVINLFAAEFIRDFCIDGKINWEKLVQFNSGNLDLDKFGDL